MDNLHRRPFTGTVEAPGFAVRVLDLPAQFYVPCDQPPGSIAGADTYTLWLAPDLALQVGGAPPEGFVSDMADGLVVFELSAPRAADVLAMGSTVALTPGQCVRTLFGGVRVTMYLHGAAMRLHAERQFAAFLLQWFQTAASALPQGQVP